jgi:hypothetical protein
MANIIQINGYTISSSNGGGGGGSDFPYTGSAIISGSLVVTGSTTSTLGFTGSLFGTASWATNALTASRVQLSSGEFIGEQNSLFTISAARPIISGSVIVTIWGNNGISLDSQTTVKGNLLPAGPYTNNTSSYNLGSPSAAWKDLYVSNGSVTFISGSTQASIKLDNNNNIVFTGATVTLPTSSTVTTAQTASYLNTLNQNLTLSGSLTILNNLTVFGTQSVVYITSSQLDISTNIITVNTSTPAVRFGGLAVKDSGSLATGRTGSLLWDSQNDVWIYSNPSGAAYDGGMLLTGPRNASGLGNEVGINSGYAAVGNGSHHMTSSAIYSSGSLIRLENNTQVTGSLNVSAGITGSLLGTASWATNAAYATEATDASRVFISENQPNNYPWSIPVFEGSGGGYSLLCPVGPSKANSSANWDFGGVGIGAGGFFPIAGTNILPPLKLTAGTNLTTPEAGAIEYDGVTLYRTNDTTSGRGYEPSTQIFRLTASLAAIGSTIANFFGPTSSIQLAGSGIYEIEAYCYFSKTTNGTITVTVSSSLAPVNLNGILQADAANGSGAVTQTNIQGSSATAVNFANSITYNTTTGHTFVLRLLVESNASNSNLRFLFTESAGTVTPLRGSYYKVTRLPSSRIGNFVA